MKKPILSIILILFLGMVSSVSVLATDSDSDFPFTDVYPTDSYYEAVKWAYENGIAKGITPTTFGPNATVTRAQTVTFLYRLAGSPDGGSHPFTDVPADAYFAGAVNWAVEQSITNGVTATEFAPDNDCTRAHIVTFLFRCFAE